jgi:N-ethylmaleimide reductase
MSASLFSSFTLGALALKNRVVMAPMTRSRAIGSVPNALMAEYYAARAEAGLIVTEGVSPSAAGLGYARIPGLFTDAQEAGWREVTAAVHARGGAIFAQLMDCGRVGHPANLGGGARLLAPSAIAAPGAMWTDTEGMQPHPAPEAMTEQDIADAIAAYAGAARRAIAAGFDGIELHGANGYLIDQFLNTASNQRTDGWGGSLAGRTRFAVAVAKAVCEAVGASRVGIRISPYGVFNGMVPDADTDALYLALIEALNPLGMAYIHVVDHSSMGAPPVSAELKAQLRARFNGAYVLSGGYDRARAEADLAADRGDLVAFGRPFISNPNLVRKLASGEALTPPNPATFYTPGPEGYTDYPAT